MSDPTEKTLQEFHDFLSNNPLQVMVHARGVAADKANDLTLPATDRTTWRAILRTISANIRRY